MTMVKEKLEKLNPKHLKIAGVALLFVKLFGIGKSLFFVLGGAAGFVLAQNMHADCEDDE